MTIFPHRAPTSTQLTAARMRLKSSAPSDRPAHTLLAPGALFAARQDDKPWDSMNPCRVSPVGNAPPELASLPAATLAKVKTVLGRDGYTNSTLTPLVAGWSGAYPFRLDSDKGSFFLKVVFEGESGQALTKLKQEMRVAAQVKAFDVTPVYELAYIDTHTSTQPFGFFVSEFSRASFLTAQPVQAELAALSQGGAAGPLLTQLTAIWKAFHSAPLAQIKDIGRSRMHPITAWQDNLSARVLDGSLPTAQRAPLMAWAEKIGAAYERRGASLPKNHVLLHSDMHASNVRWDAAAKKLVVIDFGDTGSGDPARELAYFMFMIDVPMRFAALLVRHYQRHVAPHSEAFFERSLLALAGERIGRYANITGWSGAESQSAHDYQRRIEEDLTLVSGWL